MRSIHPTLAKLLSWLILAMPAAALLSEAVAAQTPTYNVLHSFGGVDGIGPRGNPLLDSKGNLYGVDGFSVVKGAAYCSGGPGCGTVWELTPTAKGQWKRTVIYAFGGLDGGNPLYGLTMDRLGNLYGATYYGGSTSSACGGEGCGTVFKLTHSKSGWQESLLYTFTGGVDGWHPYSTVVFDKSGNLYGTTAIGGSSNCGVAFELSPTASGPWKETVVHAFACLDDGFYPSAQMAIDAAGNLYGTVSDGGANVSQGLVYELSPGASGIWTKTNLYEFTGGTDGGYPSGVVLDASGNLYGVTDGGGASGCYLGCGVVYKLSQNAGSWTQTVLYTFDPGSRFGGPGGALPDSSLALDASGNLYGTASSGGDVAACYDQGCGVVYKLSPGADGTWEESVEYAFTGEADGSHPSGLVFDPKSGNIFGTASTGGVTTGYCGNFQIGGCGVTFEITP